MGGIRGELGLGLMAGTENTVALESEKESICGPVLDCRRAANAK